MACSSSLWKSSPELTVRFIMHFKISSFDKRKFEFHPEMQTMAIEKRKTTIDHSNNFIGIMACPLSFKWFLSTVTHQTNGPCDINCTIQTPDNTQGKTLWHKQIQTQTDYYKKNHLYIVWLFRLKCCRVDLNRRRENQRRRCRCRSGKWYRFYFWLWLCSVCMVMQSAHAHDPFEWISWTDNDTWQRR